MHVSMKRKQRANVTGEGRTQLFCRHPHGDTFEQYGERVSSASTCRLYQYSKAAAWRKSNGTAEMYHPPPPAPTAYGGARAIPASTQCRREISIEIGVNWREASLPASRGHHRQRRREKHIETPMTSAGAMRHSAARARHLAAPKNSADQQQPCATRRRRRADVSSVTCWS